MRVLGGRFRVVHPNSLSENEQGDQSPPQVTAAFAVAAARAETNRATEAGGRRHQEECCNPLSSLSSASLQYPCGARREEGGGGQVTYGWSTRRPGCCDRPRRPRTIPDTAHQRGPEPLASFGISQCWNCQDTPAFRSLGVRLTACASAAGDHARLRTNDCFHCLAPRNSVPPRRSGPPGPVGCMRGLGCAPVRWRPTGCGFGRHRCRG